MNTAITVDHRGKQHPARFAIIDKTLLGSDDHGHPVLELTLNLGGGTFVEVVSHPVGMDQVLSVLRAAQAATWEQLPGNSVLALFDGEDPLDSRAVGIASTSKDQVLIFAAEPPHTHE